MVEESNTKNKLLGIIYGIIYGMIIAYALVICFVLITTSDFGFSIIQQALFLFIFTSVAPFLIVEYAWHPIPLGIIFISSIFLVYVKVPIKLQKYIFAILFVAWFFYGMFFSSKYILI